VSVSVTARWDGLGGLKMMSVLVQPEEVRVRLGVNMMLDGV
jgi:hypothetical protein